MGRYVSGTNGFTYKYVFGAQESNLYALADWAGIEQERRSYSLFTQFYAPHSDDLEERYGFVTGVGWVHSVYQGAVPPFGLIDDVEGAIYQVCDRWKEAIAEVDAAVPGIASSPDIAGGQSFTLKKGQWSTLATRIGHGADAADDDSLVAAQKSVADSGEEGFLPLLAVHALRHAIAHDLAELVIVDTEQRQTNLWSVADDYAGAYDGNAPFEDRLAYARLCTFQQKHDQARPIYDALLKERPAATLPARAIFAKCFWDDNFAEMHSVATALLDNDLPAKTRGELLTWRGEASWCLERKSETEKDAQEAADLGDLTLRHALDAAEKNEN